MTLQEVFEALDRIGGLTSSLGITWDTQDDALQCRMTVTKKHAGAPGVAHGGALAALLDTALGARALAHAMDLGMTASTVEFKVNFLRPARVGQTLITTTELQNAGRSLLVLSGKAFCAETGDAVAFAVGTFNMYKGDVRAMLSEWGRGSETDANAGTGPTP